MLVLLFVFICIFGLKGDSGLTVNVLYWFCMYLFILVAILVTQMLLDIFSVVLFIILITMFLSLYYFLDKFNSCGNSELYQVVCIDMLK